MEPEYDSFMVVLSSTRDANAWPENCSSNFKNCLPQNSDLSQYNVALSSVSYFDDFVDRARNVDQGVARGDFFGPNQNLVTVREFILAVYYVEKTYTIVPAAVNHLNAEFEANGIKAVITLEWDGGKHTSSEITYDNSEDTGLKLEIPGVLADALGFSETRFDHGKTKSSRPPDYEDFKAMGVEEKFEIRQVEWKQTTVALQQLHQPTLRQIAEQIERAVHEATLVPITVHVQEERSLIRFTMGPTVSLTLSQFLNVYLGLPPSFEIKGTKLHSVPPQILDPSGGESYIRDIIDGSRFSSNKLFVECSVVCPSYYDGKRVQILAVVNRQPGDKQMNYSPSQPIFLPVISSNFNQIHIRLLDDNLQEIIPNSMPTVATLSFKRRWM